MKRKFLASYWLYGRKYPDNHIFELTDVTDFQVPVVLKEKIASYETYSGETFNAKHVTLINFWEI